MVDGFLPFARGREENSELALQLGLPDELVERLGAERALHLVIVGVLAKVEHAITGPQVEVLEIIHGSAPWWGGRIAPSAPSAGSPRSPSAPRPRPRAPYRGH